MQDRSVACSYMPVGMNGCRFKVLSGVSIAVRQSLAGDRNDMRGQNFTDLGSKGRILHPTCTSDP